MTRVEMGGYIVRVWMPERGVVMGPREAILIALGAAGTLEEIVSILDTFSPAAFEITKDGQGCVIYPDWS